MIMDDVAYLSSSMVIRKDMSLWGWGRDIYNLIGVDVDSQQFPPIELSDDITTASTEWGDILVFEVGDIIMGFGGNHFGSLGLRRSQLDNITDVIAVSVGGTHTLAITYDGELWAWGRVNPDGRLGTGSTRGGYTPVRALTDMLITDNGRHHDRIVEVPDAVINYRSPTELGDDPSSLNMRIAGDLYTLPVPLSVFIDNGWELIDDRTHLAVNNTLGGYPIMFNGQILRTRLINPTDSNQPIENCFVTHVTFRSDFPGSTIPIELELPGGITEASSRDDVIEAYGQPDDQSVERNLEFLTYGDHRHGIRFTFNIETGRIFSIEVNYWQRR